MIAQSAFGRKAKVNGAHLLGALWPSVASAAFSADRLQCLISKYDDCPSSYKMAQI